MLPKNIAYGSSHKSKSKIINAAKLAEAASFINDFLVLRIGCQCYLPIKCMTN